MRVFVLIFFFLYVQSGWVWAQDCIPDKKQTKIVKKINRSISKGNFYNALDLLNDQDDAVVYSALKTEIAWLQDNDLSAEKFGLYTISICPDNFPKVYYFLGEIAFSRKDYISARVYLQKSIDLIIAEPYYSKAANYLSKAKVIAEILENPVPFNPVVVEGVSTKSDEYLPILSPDQDYFFFTRRFLKKGLDMLVPTYIEEFVYSQKKSGDFLVGEAMSFPFNQESNEGGASVSINNNVLYYTKCKRNRSGYNNCDIYYVYKTEEGWSDVQSFSKKISQDSTWESQPSVSADGNTIIFSSDRAGGYGNMDLYEINFVNGRWEGPKNLGPIINSSDYEKSPFLHADGKTLFFSSNSFPSIGGFDIFYSRKDSLGNWQEPINIGFPINTVFDEISLFVSTDGEKAYFASNQLKGVGGWDIYTFPLYEEASPGRVLFLKGDLLNKDGNLIDNVQLEFKNIRTQEVVTVDAVQGRYVTALSLAKNDDVLLVVKKEGFVFTSEYISSKDTMFSAPSTLDLELQSLEAGKSFNLDNVYFSTNSFAINSVVSQVLEEFADYLLLNESLIIEINGFTDNVGSAIDNQILSERRAEAVCKLLLSYGVSSSRISFNGFGESYPIADNSTEAGRAQNRRTEFKILDE